MKVPFDEKDSVWLSGSSLPNLVEWLEENGLPDAKIGGDYTAAALIADLNKICAGIWSDGIDAMGEDA